MEFLSTGKKKSDVEVASYKPKVELNVDNESALIVGVFTRKGAWWNFHALGMSGRGRTIKEIVATTALQSIVKPASADAKPRRVYLWAIEAKDVAAADFPMFGEKSSDCFAEIICKYVQVHPCHEKEWGSDDVFGNIIVFVDARGCSCLLYCPNPMTFSLYS